MLQILAIAIAIAPASVNWAHAAAHKTESFPMPMAQSVAGNGGEVVRAGFVDGYGNQAGVVDFMRRPGEEPRVEVRNAAGVTMAAIVSLETWERVRSAAVLFDRKLVPVGNTDDQSICLHPWQVSVEAVDAVRPGRPAVIRKAVHSACDTGLAVTLAFKMASEAVAALPACALLDPKQYRNDVARLAGCTLLDGDRAAAALARNAYGSDWFVNARGERTEYAIRHLFFDRAQLDWAGTAAEGSEAAAKLWSSRLENGTVVPRQVVGETADRVRIEGVIVRFADNRSYQAPMKNLPEASPSMIRPMKADSLRRSMFRAVRQPAVGTANGAERMRAVRSARSSGRAIAGPIVKQRFASVRNELGDKAPVGESTCAGAIRSRSFAAIWPWQI